MTLAGTATNGDLGFGQLRTNSFVQAVAHPADPSVLYLTVNDNPPGADRGEILFITSGDAGATWGAPVRVNDDPTTRDQWQPSLAVTPDGSRVFIGFYDSPTEPDQHAHRRVGSDRHGQWRAVTFAPNFRITSESFPAVPGGTSVNPLYMGDYDQAVADDGSFYYTWGDNRLPNPNNVAGRPRQPDVRFARIPVEGPAPARRWSESPPLSPAGMATARSIRTSATTSRYRCATSARAPRPGSPRRSPPRHRG